MFSFEPADKGLYRSGIDDNIEQRFVVRFGAEKDKSGGLLDNRLFVVLDKENIRFLYYDNDEQSETLNADYLKEVGYISLNYQKYTGNDILDFPQMSCGEIEYFPKEEQTVKPIIDSFKELFHGFPFLENIKDKKDYSLCNLLKCCLLAFVFKIEDRSEIFAQSPLYEHVRDALRKSDVYQLLSAKIQYTLSVPKDKDGKVGLVYNSKEYTYKARKFADCLMSKHINKVIPQNNYGNAEGKQGWFYDPEKELDAILEQKRKQEREGQCTLDENLVRKIRDFLYTKHAVYQAMTKDESKRYFVCAQVLMFIISLSIILSSILIKNAGIILHYILPGFLFLFLLFLRIFQDTDIVRKKIPLRIDECRKDKWVLWPVFILLILPSLALIVFPNLPCVSFISFLLIIVCPIVWIVRSGICNRNGSSGVRYAFFPRILVAELVGWLTIGIAEDLVKSMLWIDNWLIIVGAIVIVIIVVFILIGGEGKQHSPYKKTGYIIKSKTLPIVNHSLFFALIFGSIMQVVFYDDLIRNSDVMAETTFGEYFDDVDLYCQNLIDLESAVNQYQNYFSKSELNYKLKKLSQNSNSLIKALALAYRSVTTDLKETKDSVQKDTNILTNTIIDHNNIVKHYQVIVDRLLADMSQDILDTFANKMDTIVDSNDLKDTTIIKQMHKNSEKIKRLPIILQEEIANVRIKAIQYNDYDTLMSWATVGYDSIKPTGSAYLDSLTKKTIENHKCCRNIAIPFWGNRRIFPILLIFHTLIVLVLAFVTQLIISDKSVTEPL